MPGLQHSGQTGGGLHGLVNTAVMCTTLWKLTTISVTIALSVVQPRLRRLVLLCSSLRFLREKKPRFAIYENVKNITGSRFRTTFDLFVKELEDYGYNVYWQVLNAKHYGIPQNRERVYCVIVRKDLDNGKFKFPAPIPLKKALVDMLYDLVDERYYLSADKVAALITPPPAATNQ